MVYPPNGKGNDDIKSAEEHTLKDSQSVKHNERDINTRRSEEGQGRENTATNTRKHKIEGGEKAGIQPPKKTKDNPNACNTEEENELKGQRVKEVNETRAKRRKPRPILKSNSSLPDEYQSSPRMRGRKKSGDGRNLEEVAAMDTGDDVPSADATACSVSEDCIEDKVEGGVAAKNNNTPIEEDQPENAQNEEPLVSQNGAKGGEEPSSPSTNFDLAASAHLSIDTAHIAKDGAGGKSPPQPSPGERTEDVLVGELGPVLWNRKRRRSSSSTPTSTSSSGQLVDKDKLICEVASNQIKQDEKVETERRPPDEMENCSSSVECAARADLQSPDLPSPVKLCEAEDVSAAPSSVLATKPLLKEEEEDHVPPCADEGNDYVPQLEQHLKMRQLTPKSQPLASSMLAKKEEEEAFHVEDTTPIECDSDRLDEPKPLEGNKTELVKKQAEVSNEDENLHVVKSDLNECIASGDGGAKGNSGTEPEDVASCEVKDAAKQQCKLVDNHQPSVLTDKAISSKGEDLPIEPQGDVSTALKLPASANGEEGGGIAPLQHQSSSAEVCPWVQCNQCHKWMRLPPHVQPSSLSEKWACKDNVWDPNSQSCEMVEEEVVANEKTPSNRLNSSTTSNAHGVPSEVNADQWVQCEADHCHKWRRVPASVNLETLPDKWFCHMNTWDSARARCEAPEEKDEQLLQPNSRPLNQMPDGRGRRPGLGTSRPSPNLPTYPPPTPKPRGRPRRSSLTNGMAALNNAAALPSSPIKWVQCDEKSCKKWRCLPPGVDPKSLPEKWFCSMNTDKRFASCNAPEQLEEPVKRTVSPTTPHSFGGLNASTVGEGRGEYQGRGRSYILARQAKPNGKLSYREIMFSANGNLKAPFAEYGVALRMQMPLCGGVDEGMGKACSHVHHPLLRTASCYPRCGTYEAEIGVRQKVQSACSSTEFISPCKIYGQVLLADNVPPDLSTPTIIKQEHVNSHLRMLELDGIVESNEDGGFRLTSNGLVPNSRFMHGRPLKLVKAWRREQG